MRHRPFMLLIQISNIFSNNRSFWNKEPVCPVVGIGLKHPGFPFALSPLLPDFQNTVVPLLFVDGCVISTDLPVDYSAIIILVIVAVNSLASNAKEASVHRRAVVKSCQLNFTSFFKVIRSEKTDQGTNYKTNEHPDQPRNTSKKGCSY